MAAQCKGQVRMIAEKFESSLVSKEKPRRLSRDQGAETKVCFTFIRKSIATNSYEIPGDAREYSEAISSKLLDVSFMSSLKTASSYLIQPRRRSSYIYIYNYS